MPAFISKHPALHNFVVLDGPGTVSGVPELPGDFDAMFTSYRIPVETCALHAVIGGNGPPLLLLGGWPQTWYSWRHIMPALAASFTVIALETRGVGRSDKPQSGYDMHTVAGEVVEAMTLLGHDRFDAVGHDIGMWTAYAAAADYPGRITRLAVVDATIPGLSPSPPLLAPRRLSDFLWHFNFNRTYEINELLVRGREDIYFGYQFRTKAGRPDAIAPSALQHYVDMLKEPSALTASFEYYRALDCTIPQNEARRQHLLDIPVLAVGGSLGVGARVAQDMRNAAMEVREAIIDGSGHFVQEEAPEALLGLLQEFLGAHPSSQRAQS